MKNLIFLAFLIVLATSSRINNAKKNKANTEINSTLPRDYTFKVRTADYVYQEVTVNSGDSVLSVREKVKALVKKEDATQVEITLNGRPIPDSANQKTVNLFIPANVIAVVS